MKLVGHLLIVLALLTGSVARVIATEPWSLEQAIDKALSDNPEALIALHRIAAARAAVAQANAAFWPKLQIQSGYLRTDNPIAVFGAALKQREFSPALDFNNVPDADNLNVSGLLSVPLYAGGSNVAGREGAKAASLATEQDAEAVRKTLAFEVARAFHTVLKTREFARAADAAVTAFENNLSLARKRQKSGTALKTDVLDLEVRLAGAREDLVRARNANLIARRALRNLLGIEEGEFVVDETVPLVNVPQTKDYSGRPELAASRARVEAAQSEVRRARSGYLPRVDAFGSLDHDRGWEFDGSGESYTAGITVQWNLWDGLLTTAKAREALANLAAAREAERKLRLAIDLEVEQSGLNLDTATQRLAVTEKVVEQAVESVRLTRSRFQEGLALASQLIDAETALTAARVRRAEAQADQRIAVAALRKALGLSQLPNSSEGR